MPLFPLLPLLFLLTSTSTPTLTRGSTTPPSSPPPLLSTLSLSDRLSLLFPSTEHPNGSFTYFRAGHWTLNAADFRFLPNPADASLEDVAAVGEWVPGYWDTIHPEDFELNTSEKEWGRWNGTASEWGSDWTDDGEEEGEERDGEGQGGAEEEGGGYGGGETYPHPAVESADA